MPSGDEEKIRDEWKKAEVSVMAHMRKDLSTQLHGVERADWGEDLVKQNRPRERFMEQDDLEVFQYTLCQRSDEPWRQLFAHFQALVQTWTQNHPQRDLASRYHALDSYVALAFERFWRATTSHPSLVFSELPTAFGSAYPILLFVR